MRLFGVVVTTRKRIIRDWYTMASTDAQMQLRTLLMDREHPLRQAVARAARSEAKDYMAEDAEAERARFEADPAFQEWAAQRREHDLAEAEKGAPADVPPVRAFGAIADDQRQLRFGILGFLTEHGVQFTATIADEFDGWTPTEITDALAGLVSDRFVEVRHGVYSAMLAGVGLGEKEKEARNEDPDSQ